MKFFTNQYINCKSFPDTALLVSSRQETIIGAAFFDYAQKIEVQQEQFLAYLVSLLNKKLLLIETSGPFALLCCLDELKNKGVKNYFFINEAISVNPSVAIGDIIVLEQSKMISGNQYISAKKSIINKINFSKNVKKGVNLSVDLNHIFFNNSNKKKYNNIDTLSIGDYYFLKYIKENKLNGFSINYIVGNLSTDIKDKKSFNNAMGTGGGVV